MSEPVPPTSPSSSPSGLSGVEVRSVAGLGPADLLSRPPERLYRAGMLRRFGPLGLIAWLLIRRFRLSDGSDDRVRAAAERGPLVYVLHTRSRMDWLALNSVLNTHRLPLARFTNGLTSTLFAPLLDALRDLRDAVKDRFQRAVAPDPLSSGWLAGAVSRGVPVALFLTSQSEFTTALLGPATDPMPALLDAQSRTQRRVQLVPVVVLWNRRPDEQRSEVGNFVLGSQDEPTWLTKLLQLFGADNHPVVQVGEAVDLAELLERMPDEPRERQVRATRFLLRRYLYRESHVIRGPRIRPFRATRRLVLSSPEVKRLIADEAQISRKPEAEVRDKVERTLDHIAARFSYTAVRMMNRVAKALWNKIYSGVDIRDEDLERIRAALRAGTPVLVPSHRSHLDTVLMSSVMYANDIVIPHVVGGENMAFWPLGPIARRCGVFFIKRSFKGDRIFPVVFERYLRQLLRDGFPVEFFIEGTRSRTGKLLPPKLGVLGMVMDAAAGAREDRDITLLPIAISYEQIAEEGAYARELGGGSKKKEDLGQMVKASRVLKRRYGRVYIRVAEPIAVREIFQDLPKGWRGLGEERRRELLARTGERIMSRIAGAMVVLPTGLVAMALLAQSKRGIQLSQLHNRIRRFHDLLLSEGATPAASLSYSGAIVAEALRRFQAGRLITRLTDEEGEILQVIDDKRITLEYYKNGLLSFVAPASLLAAAVGAVCLRRREELDADPRPPADDAEVSRLFGLQVFLLRYEVTLDPEVPIEALEARARDTLLKYGALVPGPDGRPVPGESALLGELAGITRNLLESYWLVLRAARGLRSRDISAEDLPKRVQQAGVGLLAVDELRRPEALSMENLRNAVTAYREEGVLQIKVGGSGLQFDEAGHRQYMADLARLLGE